MAPSWTSGGAIAFETYDPFTDRQGRWLMSANGTKIRRLPAQDYDKVSPNGRLIARLTDQGTLDILTASGRRIPRIPLRLQRDDVSLEPLWSPDGRWIAAGVATETEREDYSFVLGSDMDTVKPPDRDGGRWFEPGVQQARPERGDEGGEAG